jgi:hypothetical protein
MLTLEEIVNHLSTTYMPISEELPIIAAGG